MPRLSNSDNAKNRARQLLERLLDYANDELPKYGDLRDKLKVTWSNQNSEKSKLFVDTELRYLVTVVFELSQSKYSNQPPKEQIRLKDKIREDIRWLIELGILEENAFNEQGKANKNFWLNLWSRDKDDNLKKFDEKWQSYQSEKGKLNKSNKRISNSRQDLENEPPESQEIIPPSHQDSEDALPESQETISTSRQDWGDAPDVPVFFGRKEELSTLKSWILDERCRLVAILGIGAVGKTHLSLTLTLGKGGIGKTDLSLELARGIEDQFEYVIWRSLLNAPKLEIILTDLISFLSDSEETSLPEDKDKQVSRLLHYLRQKRCLIVLDNVESILKGGEQYVQYKEGYEDYGDLFNKLGKVKHKSCLLITSREKPKELDLVEVGDFPVKCLPLKGLDESAGKKIFNRVSKSFSDSDKDSKKLIHFYGGNPLALELAARLIDELYEGNISRFLKEAEKLDIKELKDLLDWHFERLSDKQKEIMYWLVINREPVSVGELKEDILEPSKKEVQSSIKSLEKRLPLEKIKANNDTNFTLQPVLIEYTTERLIEQIVEEIKTENIEKIFNSHAPLKALAKDYVRETQALLILKPIIDKLFTIFGNQTRLETRLTQILSKLREECPLKPGYIGGNVLNLLCQLNTVLKDYDFSDLTIWQAYLQKVSLYNVNFTGSKLDKIVFTQTFGSVTSVKFSPDGTLFATGDSNGEIHLRQVVDGKLILICKGHQGWIQSVGFSPNGQIIACGGDEGSVRLWDVNTSQCLNVLQGHTSRVCSVTFSPDGQLIVSGSHDQTIRIWDVSTSQCLNTLHGHTHLIWSVGFSPDGERIVSGSEDQTIRIWDVSTGQCLNTLREHTSVIHSVAFSPDGQRIVSGSEDQTIKIWDVSTGQCINTLQGFTNLIKSIAFSPDGQIIAGSYDQIIKLWDVSTGRCLHSLEEHTSVVYSVAFSPDSRVISSGSDRTIKFWEVSTGQCIRTWQGYADWVMSVAFSPDGQTVISGSIDQMVRFWNIANSECYRTLPRHNSRVMSVNFSSDGQMVASTEDRTLKLWNASTGKLVKILQGHTNVIRSVAFSPNCQTVASTGEDRTIRIWDIITGQCLSILQGHTNWILEIAFSPDGEMIVSGSYDQTVRLWHVRSGQCLSILQGHTSVLRAVAFSPNGEIVVSGSTDRTLKIWEVSSGRCLNTLEGHNGGIESVTFSSNGQMIASSSGDGTVKLWEVSSGRCLRTLEGHTKTIDSVAFSPDCQTIASGSRDETIRIWDTNTGECLNTLKAPRPYEGVNITGVTELTEVDKSTLKALGAIEN